MTCACSEVGLCKDRIGARELPLAHLSAAEQAQQRNEWRSRLDVGETDSWKYVSKRITS